MSNRSEDIDDAMRTAVARLRLKISDAQYVERSLATLDLDDETFNMLIDDPEGFVNDLLWRRDIAQEFASDGKTQA